MGYIHQASWATSAVDPLRGVDDGSLRWPLTGNRALLDVRVIAYCLLGVTVGTFIGVLPGIGSLAAVSMLLPISFYLDPMTAIILLGGVY